MMTKFKNFHDVRPADMEETMNRLIEYGFNIAGIHQYKEEGKTVFLVVGSVVDTAPTSGDIQQKSAKK